MTGFFGGVFSGGAGVSGAAKKTGGLVPKIFPRTKRAYIYYSILL